MNKLFGEMNVHSIMHNGAIIAVALIVAIIIITVVATILVKKGMMPNKLKIAAKIVMIICAIVAITTCIVTGITIIKYNEAVKHGAYTDDMTVSAMYEGIRYSPIEDELPENLTGYIVIYYRFDCPDCHAVYDELSEQVKDNDKVCWISSRSTQGKALLASYPVDEVPSGIYFREYTYGGALTYTKKRLYTTDDDGNTILSSNGINRLLELQSSAK